jgi:iron complex transport system substrate-binding protein
MGQSASMILLLIFSALGFTGGCERTKQSTQPPAVSTTQTSRVTVASLVPAATDLIIGMGAVDHLVAVSNWDAPRKEIEHLPRAGDYRNVDWEKLAQARPQLIVVQFREDKMPAGLSERAGELGAKLLNVHNNRLDDLYPTIRLLGEALGEKDKAKVEEERLKKQLDEVRKRSAGKPPVKAFIGRDATQLASVGGGNYLDELLTLAGGKNVIEGGENSYPTIDRERLTALDPEVVILLLPGASEQVIEAAKHFWSSMTELTSVKHGKVYVWTEDWLLLPGSRVGDLARKMQDVLHPSAAAQPPAGGAS